MITNRFYPDVMPYFANEPTRDLFDIVKVSDGVGVGVMTCQDFKTGDVLFSFTGFFSGEITQYTLQVSDGLHLHDPFFMGRVLHSCDPNSSCNMETRTFYALRDIKAGEFITMDYCETEDYLFKTFPCCCGADNCRGEVKGRMQ
jgi:hypothetical protein